MQRTWTPKVVANNTKHTIKSHLSKEDKRKLGVFFGLVATRPRPSFSSALVPLEVKLTTPAAGLPNFGARPTLCFVSSAGIQIEKEHNVFFFASLPLDLVVFFCDFCWPRSLVVRLNSPPHPQPPAAFQGVSITANFKPRGPNK